MPLPRPNPAPRGEDFPISSFRRRNHWYTPQLQNLPPSMFDGSALPELMDAMLSAPWYVHCIVHLLPGTDTPPDTLIEDVRCLFCTLPLKELIERQPPDWALAIFGDDVRGVNRLVGARAISIVYPQTYHLAGKAGANAAFTVVDRELPIKLY